MATRGRRFEEKRKFSMAAARFCPFCGADRLHRDEFASDSCRNKDSSNTVEFICQICFRGFRLVISRRAATANRIFALERKQRVSNDGMGQVLDEADGT